MGLEILAPRAECDNLLPREETRILWPGTGGVGPAPTFNLPFMTFQAIIRPKRKSSYHPSMNSAILVFEQIIFVDQRLTDSQTLRSLYWMDLQMALILDALILHLPMLRQVMSKSET